MTISNYASTFGDSRKREETTMSCRKLSALDADAVTCHSATNEPPAALV